MSERFLRDPNHQILASTDQHAIDVWELNTWNRLRVKLHKWQFFACVNIPKEDLLIVGTTYHILWIRGETCFQWYACLIEVRCELSQLQRGQSITIDLTILPSKASISTIAFSDVPSMIYCPLNENFKNLISGMSSMLNILNGLYMNSSSTLHLHSHIC